ncbi:MAG: hypothetical protein M3441_00985 [Chloroflexota bacterium]|nr:hypothetical protein [Chloroflexota bacterium]
MDQADQDILRLKQALQDAAGSPASLFDILPESVVWSSAKLVLDQDDGSEQPDILLDAIDAYLPRATDAQGARDVLLHILATDPYGLLFRRAQRIILNHATIWSNADSKVYADTFEHYYSEEKEPDGDHFRAAAALEGLVMLALLRNDNGPLYKAIGVLMGDFPAVPADPHDAAYLPVKALKLLSRCFDRRPSHSDLVKEIEARVDVPNFAVDTEARYALGLVRLYDAFRAEESTDFVDALAGARDLFENAARSEENRTDAELFAAVTNCYLALTAGRSIHEATTSVQAARSAIWQRLTVLSDTGGDLVYEPALQAESNLLQLALLAVQWGEQLVGASTWHSIEPHLQVLAKTYASLRDLEMATELGIDTLAAAATRERVMLPLMHGRFVSIQEIKAKLDKLIEDARARPDPPTELEFYEVARRTVENLPSPKDSAAAFQELLAAAKRGAPRTADRIAKLITDNSDPQEGILEVLWQDLEIEREANRVLHGPAQTIYNKLVGELLKHLDWGTGEPRWIRLSDALRYVARFFMAMLTADRSEWPAKMVDFLFSKENKGKGKEAVEADLETMFHVFMKAATDLVISHRQPISVTSGRPDLYMQYSDGIGFVVEVKKEEHNVSRDAIRAAYLVQAQQYAASTIGVSFMFVLDLTTKKLEESLKNASDYCYVDYRPVLDSETPTRVVVVIFPANRRLPSDSSA